MGEHVVTRVTGRIEAPAARVWEWLSWRGAARLRAVSLIERITLEDDGEGVGSVRVLHLKGGSRVSEYVEAIDDQQRWYIYRPTTLGSLPVRDYTGHLAVIEAGPDACIVNIESRCIPVGITVEEWQRLYRELENSVIDHVRRQVG